MVTTAERPLVSIVIPVMDRWADLVRSLPSLSDQTYANYSVDVVALGGDGIPIMVHRSPRVRLLALPRPRYLSFSWVRNVGAQYSEGDLLLFMNADNEWVDSSSMERAIDLLLCRREAEPHWYRDWREMCGFRRVRCRTACPLAQYSIGVYGHAHGSILLVERCAFMDVGGYDEMFSDWGFEDTDLLARLECAGLARVALPGVIQRGHGDDERLANFKVRDRNYTWHRNRLFSERSTRWCGCIHRPAGRPGIVSSVELRVGGRPQPLQSRGWMTGRTLLHQRLLRRLLFGLCALQARISLPWLRDVTGDSYEDQVS